jgi:ATP-dependent helicase/nuclease subunit A
MSRRPGQRRGVAPKTASTRSPRFPSLVIRASAGTGKTFALSSRYLSLIAAGMDANEILAASFTRKASAEILSRILLRLAEAAESGTELRKLARHINAEDLNADHCMALLERLARNLHRLRVGTLDSFFALLARSHSLELGISPGWQIIDELEDARIRGQAIAAVLAEDRAKDTLAVVHLLSKGETDRSVSGLMRDTIDALYGIYQETTAEAWTSIARLSPRNDAELAVRIEALRSAPLDKPFAESRDRECALALAGEWESFVAAGVAAKLLAGDRTYRRAAMPESLVEVYRPLVDHARAVIVAKIASQTEGTHKLLDRFARVYERLKAERHVMRFEDVTVRLAKSILFSRPEELAFRLDGRIEHLLLDEFQDTSLAQWQVVRPFAARAATHAKGSLFCVGDTKQAIYGWRGGIAELFDALPLELQGIREETLSQSFRSSPIVIETVNRVFAHLDRHPNLERASEAVNRWTHAFPAHSTAKESLAGYCCLETAPAAADGERAQDATFAFAANRVAGIAAETPDSSVGVLVRRNDTVARLIYLLRRLGIPASEEGGSPLVDSAAVQIVLSAARLADHPGDTVARFHVAHSPLAADVGIVRHSDDAAAATAAANLRRRFVEEGYGPIVATWARILAVHANRREMARLEQLVRLACDYDERASLRADDFVALVNTQKVADAIPAHVRVMTVHQAKGLQFDVVVLPELDVGLTGQPDAFVVHRPSPGGPVERVCRHVAVDLQALLPAELRSMFEEATRREVEESLCLLYVSLTRAVHAVHMIIAPSLPSEKSLHKTFAGLLRASLTDGKRAAPETFLFEHGDREWWRQPDRSAAAKAVMPPMPAPQDAPAPLVVRVKPAGGARRRGLEVVRASALEGGPVVLLGERLQVADRPQLRYGRVMHAWYELVGWLEDGMPDDDALRRTAATVGADDLDIDAMLGRFRQSVGRPSIGAMLSRASYKRAGHGPHALPLPRKVLDELAAATRIELRREQPIAALREAGVLSGTIDRLVLLYQDERLVAADIMDFKTDRLEEGDADRLAERTAFYRPQMVAYREALAAMTGLASERIASRLLFVGPGIVSDLFSPMGSK